MALSPETFNPGAERRHEHSRASLSYLPLCHKVHRLHCFACEDNGLAGEIRRLVHVLSQGLHHLSSYITGLIFQEVVTTDRQS